jgi:molecular chaperone GrpE (heat shock protein)
MLTRKFDGRGTIFLELNINGEKFRCNERIVCGIGGVLVGTAVGFLFANGANRGRLRRLQIQVRAAVVEADSARARAVKDVVVAKDYGNAKLLKDLLPTCDNLDNAMDALSCDASLKIIEGIKLTRDELFKVLASHNVQPIPVSVGDKFDHNLCEAMMQTPIPPIPVSEPKSQSNAPQALSGTVSLVLSKGYMHGPRILRPAKVAVYE